MPSKRIRIILIFSVGLGLSCANHQSDSIQNVDSAALKNKITSNIEYQSIVNRYNLGDSAESHMQKAFNNLFIDFNNFKSFSTKIEHRVAYDLGSLTTTCHFKDGEFKYYNYQTSEEGGYFVVELIHSGLENRHAARVTSESDGFFKLVNRDTSIWYSVVIDERLKYVVGEVLTEIPNFLESAPDSLISTVVNNKHKFKLVNGKYEWYLRKEKKIGYFGKEIEEYEVIRVDSNLLKNLIVE